MKIMMSTTRLKRLVWVVIATVFCSFQLAVGNASALTLDEATRTISANAAGDTVTLSTEQVIKGEKFFNSACTKCHLQGKTKTNNNVSLGLEDLAGAFPARDNVAALVSFLEEPMSYDGEEDISELHPATSFPEIWPEMRNLSEDDLTSVAGYMLIAPKLDAKWGGTIYF